MYVPRPRRLILYIGVGFVLSIVMIGTVGRSWIEDLFAKPAPTATPVALSAQLSVDEQSFYDTVMPHILVVDAEANVLAEMGKAHSRNLFELQARGKRVEENASQIEAYVAANGVPARFAPAYQQFSEGIALIRQAMNDSRQGMLSFDWDKVAATISVFENGANAVSEATYLMQGTPIAEATPPPN